MNDPIQCNATYFGKWYVEEAREGILRCSSNSMYVWVMFLSQVAYRVSSTPTEPRSIDGVRSAAFHWDRVLCGCEGTLDSERPDGSAYALMLRGDT